MVRFLETIHPLHLSTTHLPNSVFYGFSEIGMMGLEPTAYALEGHCSFHLRYIPVIGTRFELALPP